MARRGANYAWRMSVRDVHDKASLRARLRSVDVRALPAEGRRHAAVAVGVTEAGFGADVEGMPRHETWSEAPALLLTRRASDLRAHAGQWAFPGGRLDDCAARSGYVITPVVVWAGAARDVVPNAAEVASIPRIPVSELLRDDAPLLNHVRGAEHPVLRMPIGTRWIAAPT